MNRPTDESQIREMIQRLKHVDEQSAPDFDEVLQFQVRKMTPAPVDRFKWAFVGCAAMALLGALLFIQSPKSDPSFANDPHRDQHVGRKQPVDLAHEKAPQRPMDDIDFDHLRQVVQEHCRAEELATGSPVPVWTSRTESLLAWSSDLSQTQE